MRAAPLRVLFVDADNSSRSQIAEGFARAAATGALVASSAGLEPKPIHRLARRVLADIGIGIDDHRSKALESVADQPFNVVIALCDLATETCPLCSRSVKHTHWSVEDPAGGSGGDAERLPVFRRVRSEIMRQVSSLAAVQGPNLEHVLRGPEVPQPPSRWLPLA